MKLQIHGDERKQFIAAKAKLMQRALDELSSELQRLADEPDDQPATEAAYRSLATLVIGLTTLKVVYWSSIGMDHMIDETMADELAVEPGQGAN